MPLPVYVISRIFDSDSCKSALSGCNLRVLNWIHGLLVLLTEGADSSSLCIESMLRNASSI